MTEQDAVVYVLVGPKGAGKTHVGRLAEEKLGITFVDVEALALSQRSTGERSTAVLYRDVVSAVRAALVSAQEVMLEVTGAAPETSTLLEDLRAVARVRLIAVQAPVETCVERVRTRDVSAHLPAPQELVREVHRRSTALGLTYDLQIDNSAASEDDLLAALAALRKVHRRCAARRS